MNQAVIIIITLCINVFLTSSFSTDWLTEFDYYTYLDEYELFRLYWNNLENDMIEFGMEAAATGWIALGISRNGQMPGSDIAIGWVDDDGNVYLQDRYTTGRTTPLYEPNQNLTLIEGEEVDGMTRIRFMRAKYTCNENDIQLSQGTTRLIWAFHATADPTEECFDSSSITFHTNKGSQSLNLNTGVQAPVELGDNVQYLDITMDEVAVPSTDTTYWCKLFKIPDTIDTDYHIVKFSPIVEEGNEGAVHHLLAYKCDDWMIRNDSDIGTQGPCHEAFENMPARECRGGKLVYAWAIGATDVYMPEGVGLPIGGDSGFKYVLMEMHYDNPELRSDIVDSSGYRMYYTTPRAIDAGLMNIGSWTNQLGQLIPPGLPYAHNAAFMPGICTEDLEEDIYIFGNVLHQHTIGVASSLRIIRDGKELEPLDSNWNYDFNYQNTVVFDPPKVLKAGDTLILDCYVDSTSRDYYTVGGESTSEEMCFTFFYYYPAVDFLGASSAKFEAAFSEWLSDAIGAGYVTGWAEFNATGDPSYLGYNTLLDGAAEFYDLLWEPGSKYDSNFIWCGQTNGTGYETIYWGEGVPQPSGFTPYEPDIFECDTDIEGNGEGTCVADGPDLTAPPGESGGISLIGNMGFGILLGFLGFMFA